MPRNHADRIAGFDKIHTCADRVHHACAIAPEDLRERNIKDCAQGATADLAIDRYDSHGAKVDADLSSPELGNGPLDHAEHVGRAEVIKCDSDHFRKGPCVRGWGRLGPVMGPQLALRGIDAPRRALLGRLT